MTREEILTHKIKLNNGVLMPQFGLGTYLMNKQDEAYQAVLVALENGYRHIDTAQYYKNETEIGRALKDFLAKHPEVKRADIFITSKIWNDDHEYEKAKQAFSEILKRLDVEYLDLCLVHWPTKNRYQCWKFLEEAYQAGKVRAIGVSNFKVHHLEDFLKQVKIKPMVNQIETHPGFNQLDVVEFCQKNDIVVTSWRTMMGGKTDEIPLLVDLAKKYQTSTTQIALKWAWQLNEIIIPKSVTPKRIIDNPNIGSFTLTEEEITAINNLPQKRIGADPDDKSVWKNLID
ncbi:aldo/keto reductase [Spiroplasma platyhelix]|uniref:Aldo/keto reductase n=1 Tax=Spiroplasma platyhelix PALS-1 TaxID=1276218 RepID=A0A846U4U0_9MOLU|nr:aldo/keto reductase [Spiroplasma platyhelix]MBE4704107.1 Glyoxal reductase [Spiroplasma platyhelix PALS-1]NKE38477.1 aldo/keto reductase [Spiroplasma platyhelix PALS-1]UJB29365.1 aldo/keto reductase [Spiroplasma platyhelix PALS-1]